MIGEGIRRRPRKKTPSYKVLEEVDPNIDELSSLPADDIAPADNQQMKQNENFDASFNSEEDMNPLVIDTADSPESAADLSSDNHILAAQDPSHDTLEDASREVSPAPSDSIPSAVPSPASLEVYAAGHLVEQPMTVDFIGRSRTDSVSSSSSSPGLILPTMSDLPIPQIPKIKQQSPSKTRRKSDKIQPIRTDEGVELFVCPICAEKFTSSHVLTKHIRAHNTPSPAGGNSANTCKLCGKVLSSQSSLDRHMLVHSGERPFKCNLCKMSFTTNGNMHRHSRIHSKELGAAAAQENLTKSIRNARKKSPEDDEGNKVRQIKRKTPDSTDEAAQEAVAAKRYIMSKEGMKGVSGEQRLSPYKGILNVGGSLEQGEEEELQCPVCRRGFSSKYGLEAHLDSHENTQTECSFCKITFPNPSRLYVHYIIAHTSKQQNDEMKTALYNNNTRPNKTVPVGFHDLSFVDFSSDKFSHVAKAWCEDNQRRPSSGNHKFICSKCQHSFPSSNSLKLHLETHAPQNKAMCTICNTNFSSCREYDLHSMQHLSDKIITNYSKKSGSIDNNDVQDMVSKEEFLLVVGLKLSKDSSAQKPLDKLVATEGLDLSNDGKEKSQTIESKAQVNKLIKQNEKKAAQFQHRMPSSMYQKHTELRIPKPLQTRSNLLKNRSDGEEEEDDDVTIIEPVSGPAGPWKCNFCPRLFNVYKAYQDHLREHLPASTTSFACQYCSYVSGDKSTLIRHLRTHNGERPYQCKLCKFAFTTKPNCERHVRKRHDMNNKEEIERHIISLTSNGHDEGRKSDTICKVCGEDFKQVARLQYHLCTSSVCQSKVYICQLCRAGYPSKLLCVAHLQKAHPEIQQSRYNRYITVSAASKESSFPSIPAHPAWTTPIPPTAFPLHLSPVTGTTVPAASPHLPVVSTPYKASTYITSPPTVNIPLKKEQENMEEDKDDDVQPLDFSMKAASSLGPVEADEQPIDLTISSLPAATAALQQSMPNSSHRVSPRINTASKPLALKLPLITPQQTKLEQSYKQAGYHQYYKSLLRCLQCPHCPMIFKQGPELLLHIKSHNKESPYQCKYCDAAYEMKSQLDNHLTHDHNENLIPISRPSVSQSKPYDVIVIAPDEDNEITSLNNPINRDYLNKGNQQQQMTDIVIENGSGSVEYFASLDDPQGGNKKRNSYSDSPHKLQCPHCPRAFPWVSSLKRHLLTHTGIKPFKCPACPVTFSTKSNRERHMIRKHALDIHDAATQKLLEKPYICEVCSVAAYATASALVTHYGEDHADVEIPDMLKNQAKCEENPVTLSAIPDDALSCISEQSESKMSHESDVDDVGEEVIDAQQTSTPVLDKNADVESPRGVSPIADEPKQECWKCNKSFNNQQELSKHLKTHNLSGHYRCSTCDAAFNTRLESLHHLADNHQNDWFNIKEKNSINDIETFARSQDEIVDDKIVEILDKFGGSLPEPHDEDARGADYIQRKLYCSLCHKRFWSLQDLRRHVRCHTGERPFQCHVCHQRFTLKHCMVRHLRTHNVTKHNNTSSSSSSSSSTVSSDSALGSDQSTGLLNSLLGVEDSQLNQMLNSVNDAAQMLGMQ